MKKHYVVTFLFTPDLQKVWLIEKQKPEWQKGCLNGIGGKIEDYEAPKDEGNIIIKYNKMKKYQENNEFFEDEVLLAKATKDAYLDQEYNEFEEAVKSGKITEMDCKNPMWLDLFYKIRENQTKILVKEIAINARGTYQSETNHSDYLKHGEDRDVSPDDHDG